MSHYRILVTGRFEFADSCICWSTYQDLKTAGHAVEMIDVRRCPNALDEHGKPNGKALARFCERFRPDYIARDGETAEQVLAALADAPAHEGPAPRHFVVFGYIGPDNFGDDLLFRTVCAQLYARYPGCFVSVIGYNPSHTLERHGVSCVRAADKAEANALLNGASALIFLGGIMLDGAVVKSTAGMIDMFLNPAAQIPGQTAMVELAYLNDVPSVFLGIGAGPLENPDARALVRLGSLTGARYITRDGETARLLTAAGVAGEQISQKADLAFAAAYADPAAGGLSAGGMAAAAGDWRAGGCFAVALRDEGLTPALERALARAFDECFKRDGLVPVFVALAPEDVEVHKRVASLMENPDVAVHLGCPSDLDVVTATIACARFVVGMRLHASIVAAAQGTPCVGIDYNVKVGQTYCQLELEDFLLPLNAAESEVLAVFARMCAEHEQVACAMRKPVAANKRLAEEAFCELFSLVDATSPAPHRQLNYSRSRSREAIECDRVRNELKTTVAKAKKSKAKLAKENKSLKARLAKIENSRIWKLRCRLTNLTKSDA